MKTREIGNLIFHIVGAAVMSVAVAFNYWLAIPVLTIFAYLRENAQHSELGLLDFTWITPHRMFEVLHWTIGSTVGCVIWHVLLRLVFGLS